MLFECSWRAAKIASIGVHHAVPKLTSLLYHSSSRAISISGKGWQLCMADSRKTDKDSRKWFRSSRLFEHADKWFFYTREGTTEGPFDDECEAQLQLEQYIKVMDSGLISSDSEWELSPKKP